MSDAPDPDLRDVFKLLYAEDEDDTWAAFSDDDEQPTADDIIPQTELERVEEDVLPLQTTGRYTRKRFLAELDSLFDRSPETSTSSSSKRQRIYTAPTVAPSVFINSSTPITDLPSLEVYAPFSPLAFLARLRTFNPASFPMLPPPLDSVSLALSGWTSVGNQTLRCEQCRKLWSIKGLDEIADERIRSEVIRRLGKAQRDTHGAGCPWRLTSSPNDLVGKLRGLLHPMITSSLGRLKDRLQVECLNYGEVRWTSPLNDTQLNALDTRLEPYSSSLDPASSTPPITSAAGPSTSTTASAMAIFGWFPHHPNASSQTSIDVTSTPHRTDIVSCRICSRRVGLWSFKSEKGGSRGAGGDEVKSFDLQKEHLAWCPLRTDGWWEGTELLRSTGTEKGASQGDLKGWLVISDKLEKKPWRR